MTHCEWKIMLPWWTDTEHYNIVLLEYVDLYLFLYGKKFYYHNMTIIMTIISTNTC